MFVVVQVALSAGLLPVVLLFPWLPSLVECPREDEEPVSIRRQVANIWDTVRHPTRSHLLDIAVSPMFTCKHICECN